MKPPAPLRTARRNQRGAAMALAIFMMAVLLLAASGSFLIGSSNVRATRNYRGAGQVHMAAESGITDALQAINAVGVIDFQSEIVNQWDSFYGTNTRSFAPLPGFSYTVTPVVVAANPSAKGQLLATATGPEGYTNVVVANMTRSDVPVQSPGAIYLATDAPTNATFNGNAFAVDGNDHLLTGGPGPNPAVPGIATRTDANTQETSTSLSVAQKDNVLGAGFSAGPPMVPSVMTSASAPTTAQMNKIIDDILAKATAAGTLDQYPDQNVNGGTHLGTKDSPRVSHFTNTGGTVLKANGNTDGAGVMIVEGDLTVQGDFDFVGLILVRGKTSVQNDTQVTGNATIYGSLWTQDINLTVGGSGIVNYSSEALAIANNAGGMDTLPSPMKVNTLADCAQLAAGTGGCP